MAAMLDQERKTWFLKPSCGARSPEGKRVGEVLGREASESRTTDGEEFLDQIYRLTKTGNTDAATDKIFDYLDRLLCNRLFEICDEILSKVDVDKIPPILTGAFLAITSAATHELPSRKALHERIERKNWLQQLESFAELQAGWNSYSAPTPSQAAINNAKALVVEAIDLGLAIERVEPSAMGGIGVTFEAEPKEVVVEFYNNGTAHALFANDKTVEMSTRSVRCDASGYRLLIDEVGKFLNAK
jgi:hypothetical protein